MITHHVCATLSGLIYDDWEEVDKQIRAMRLRMVGKPIAHAGAESMVVRHAKWAVLVFRGTEATKGSVSDIFSNVGLPRNWAGQGKAHSGYNRHFSMIRYAARERAELVPSEIPLYVTGHSLGGSLATMYAAWVGSGGPNDHKIDTLVTFGAPKTLSEDALATIACETYRYTNKYDFAPHWPPVPGLGHPEKQVKVDSGGWPGPISRHGVGKYMGGTA